MSMPTGARLKHLDCCCCGGDAPAYKQWWNRDTGYGCCPSCYDEAVEREGLDAAISHYGHAGIHHLGTPPATKEPAVETPLGEQLDGGGEIEI